MSDVIYTLFGSIYWVYPTIIAGCLFIAGIVIGAAIERAVLLHKPEVD